MKLFTDERHDLVAAVRKYGVFADGPALPVCDTDFPVQKCVSAGRFLSFFRKTPRDTYFFSENHVSGSDKKASGSEQTVREGQKPGRVRDDKGRDPETGLQIETRLWIVKFYYLCGRFVKNFVV